MDIKERRIENELEISQDGFGKIIPGSTPGKEYNRFLIDPATSSMVPVFLQGNKISALFQSLPGEGFCIWFSRYWTEAPATLRARGGQAVLELRVTLKNKLRGTWDNIAMAELPNHYFQLGYTPAVATVAYFDGPLEYQTFDIHFDLTFLQSLELQYPELDRFISKVMAGRPAELSAVMHRCSSVMTDAINHILHTRNNYSTQARKWLLTNSVECILVEALELTGAAVLDKSRLSKADIEGLHYVREMINNNEDYLGNSALVKKARLNRQKFHKGFKDMFNITPYQYFLAQRIPQAKKLLLEGMPVDQTAYSVGYESPSSFIKAFKKKVGMPPGQWLKHNETK